MRGDPMIKDIMNRIKETTIEAIDLAKRMSEPKESIQAEPTEKQKLADYASKGLRGPKYGIFEQLLAQHLVQATVSSEPLRKIQLVAEAALMIDTEKQKALDIHMEKLEIVRAITEAFNHRTEITNKHYECLVAVEFGFEETEENYNRFIKPWGPDQRLSHYPVRLAHHYSHIGTSYRKFYCASCRNFVADDVQGTIGVTDKGTCKYCGANLDRGFQNSFPFIVQHAFKKHDSTPDWQMFFAYCHALSQQGYAELKGFFLKSAMPFVMFLMNKLTQVVRPEIYNEIAKMFVKARRETQE